MTDMQGSWVRSPLGGSPGFRDRRTAWSSQRGFMKLCFASANIIPLRPTFQSISQQRPMCPILSCQQSSGSPRPCQKVSRRAALFLLMASLAAANIAHAAGTEADNVTGPKYDAVKTRRYVGIGRPEPDRPAPQFEAEKKLFQIDAGLEAQDIQPGRGDVSVRPGSLVVARWTMTLPDGTTVDIGNEKQAAMFRPGAHQVPPGIEDSVIGMRAGGVRRVKGTSERILTNVAMGYDIGERSLVPNGSNVFIDIFVDGIDPYGRRVNTGAPWFLAVRR